MNPLLTYMSTSGAGPLLGALDGNVKGLYEKREEEQDTLCSPKGLLGYQEETRQESLYKAIHAKVDKSSSVDVGA